MNSDLRKRLPASCCDLSGREKDGSSNILFYVKCKIKFSAHLAMLSEVNPSSA